MSFRTVDTHLAGQEHVKGRMMGSTPDDYKAARREKTLALVVALRCILQECVDINGREPHTAARFEEIRKMVQREHTLLTVPESLAAEEDE